jgi:hypothetical protein
MRNIYSLTPTSIYYSVITSLITGDWVLLTGFWVEVGV